MQIFITGATGLLGNNITRQAIERQYSVRALVRQPHCPESLEGLEVDCVHGDLSDHHVIESAARGCTVIIHAAAHIHLGWKFLDQAMQVNRQGTENVVRAAKKHGIPLIHVSTVNTLPVGRGEVLDENGRGSVMQVPCTYVRSKIAADEVVRAAVAEGLQATIVHPGFMLGPWDWKLSSGRMIVEVAQRWTPISPAGGCSVCDVRDVANAILNAAQKGTKSSSYILAGENLTYFDLWTRIAMAVNKRPPLIRVRPFGRFVGSRWGDLLSCFMKGEHNLNSAAMKMSTQFHYYSSQKAMQDLEYQTRPVDHSIADTVAWLRERRMM